MKSNVLSLVRSLHTEVLVDVLFKLAEAHPETFESLIITQAPDTPVVVRVPDTNMTVRFTNAQYDELKNMGKNLDKKVTGIKRIREISGLGLKEAKDLFEDTFQHRMLKPTTTGNLGDLIRENLS